MDLHDDLVRLTPTVAADAEALRAIRRMPEVARHWDEVEDDFPMDDEPEATRFTIRHDGEIVGMVQYSEELEPKYRSAAIDIFLSAAHHGRGIGSAAVRLVVRHLFEDRGHHRITIDPAADNQAAIGAYTKAGFTPVGIMRLAERDADGRGWHDALMMELVRDPGRPPAG
jgi:aminoglycoside 6'-N-acetyltransferase